MKGELWQIINDHIPTEAEIVKFANIQQAIQDGLVEVYSANISYPHFLERKDNFHEELRKTIHEVISNKENGIITK